MTAHVAHASPTETAAYLRREAGDIRQAASKRQSAVGADSEYWHTVAMAESLDALAEQLDPQNTPPTEYPTSIPWEAVRRIPRMLGIPKSKIVGIATTMDQVVVTRNATDDEGRSLLRDDETVRECISIPIVGGVGEGPDEALPAGFRPEPGPEVTDLPEGANVRLPSEYMRPGMRPWTTAEAAYVEQTNTEASR